MHRKCREQRQPELARRQAGLALLSRFDSGHCLCLSAACAFDAKLYGSLARAHVDSYRATLPPPTYKSRNARLNARTTANPTHAYRAQQPRRYFLIW